MVTNEPDSRRLSPVDPREAQKPLRRLERGQQIAAALASQTETAVVPRCP